MSDIACTKKEIEGELRKGVKLVAISKYHPEEQLMEAYNASQRLFGESHVQELQRKHDSLPSDIEWHFIGHLQTNKVKYIAPYVSLIHAVDTEKLLLEINKQGIKCGRKIPLLLQLHVAKEETKFGFTFNECEEMLSRIDLNSLEGVEIKGVMCMASNTDDENLIRLEFRSVYKFFQHLKATFFSLNEEFSERSYGMSSDYQIAMEEGATLVRIGTRIFGPRVY